MRVRGGFTIIELMMVVAIIIVLLALFASLLDRAIYEAELAVCATRLNSTSASLTNYALSFRKSYPYRARVHEKGDWEPHKLYQKFVDGGIYDERPMLKDFVAMKSMLDPFCPKIAIDIGDTQPDDLVFRNSHQWAGFKWKEHAGMMKLGDRLTWTDTVNYSEPRTYRFTVIAADRDFININPAVVDSSHPDKDGWLTSRKWQSEDVSGGFGLLADVALQATYSGWFITGKSERGPSDLNYAYADGSVRRLIDVLYKDDPRMARVPHFADPAGVPTVGAWPTQYDNLPRE